MQVCGNMVRGSAVYEGVREHCRSMGWEEVEIKSERVMDMSAAFGAVSGWQGEAMMVKSVRVEELRQEKVMEVLDYVEGGVL